MVLGSPIAGTGVIPLCSLIHVVAARKAYAEAVALDPEHEKAARSLARVEALPDPVEKTEPTLAIAGPATPTIDEEASDDEAR